MVSACNTTTKASSLNRGEKVGDISNKIRVKLQRLLCGYLWDKVMEKGDSLTAVDQERLLQDLFHGKQNTPDSISYSYLFSQGQDVFKDMFDNVEGQKVLKWVYHRTNKQLVLGDHITRECVERVHKNSVRLLSGRNIMDKRKSVIPNVRKAFAYLKRYIDMSTGVILPGHSGWDIEDVLHAVRLDMYTKLVVRKKKVTEDDSVQEVQVVSPAVDTDVEQPAEKDDNNNNQDGTDVSAVVVSTPDNEENNNTNKVPDDFVWPGWMLFLFVAPFEENIKAGRVANNFKWEAPNKKEVKSGKLGQNALRKRKSEEEAFNRAVDNNRGSRMTVTDQFQVDSLKLRENSLHLTMCGLKMEQNKQRTASNDSVLFNITQQINSLHLQIKEVFEMIKQQMPGVSHDDVRELWKKIGEKRLEMEKLQQESAKSELVQIPKLKSIGNQSSDHSKDIASTQKSNDSFLVNKCQINVQKEVGVESPLTNDDGDK